MARLRRVDHRAIECNLACSSCGAVVGQSRVRYRGMKWTTVRSIAGFATPVHDDPESILLGMAPLDAQKSQLHSVCTRCATSCYNASTRSSDPGRRQKRSAFTKQLCIILRRLCRLFAPMMRRPLATERPGAASSSENCEHIRGRAVLTKGD